ncbi:unnamed protein product [Prunus armeniaca]|uniref:Uncharacterized protein n=1 Tax=Prunus armeniaca TaxID=36596 RepID=A0A6J5Y8L7_PRUAR|nr:unnamed protein product [Prunus armeniaca]CAB4320882.1 unnamed protein product [Prunus armeniaca]
MECEGISTNIRDLRFPRWQMSEGACCNCRLGPKYKVSRRGNGPLCIAINFRLFKCLSLRSFSFRNPLSQCNSSQLNTS